MMALKEEISGAARRAIESKTFPGCVVGYVRKNGERAILPFGNFTYEPNSSLVKEDTIYDVASITKSIPTASLALMLIDQGKLKITEKLIDYVPEFRNSDRENILIKHLLTYTLDGYGLASLKENSADKLLEILMTRDFERRPGTVFKYTNIPMILMGMVIEKIMRETLDVLAQKYFFGPLKMHRTTFFPERFPKEEVTPTEIDDWRGLVHGAVHDESAYIFKRAGKIMGHAGLFSTIPNLLNFMEMLLQSGRLHGQTFFSEETLAHIQENQIPELHDYTGLGWELNQPRFMGKFATERTFGKTGFTGTLCVCDMEKEIAYVILSNRTYPKRPTDAMAINKFRAEIGDIILGNA
jgi:CubicO group peptidase (beta-lactamase class C family)